MGSNKPHICTKQPGNTLSFRLFPHDACCGSKHAIPRALCSSDGLQAKLKQLIKQALSLTSTSYAIASINPSARRSNNRVLTASSFDTLFTISPSVLPNKSAAAMKLAIGENDMDDEDVMLLKNREVCDQRWQILALLGERSTVKEALRQVR